MKIAAFQLQIRDSSISAIDFIRNFDVKAPKPQPLEGGNGQGPRYEVILNAIHFEKLLEYCTKNPSIVLYTSPCFYEINSELYRPENIVEWRFGQRPSIQKKSHV